jgi:hypothetical protein
MVNKIRKARLFEAACLRQRVVFCARCEGKIHCWCSGLFRKAVEALEDSIDGIATQVELLLDIKSAHRTIDEAVIEADIYGAPTAPILGALTPLAVKIASKIYDERRFEDMPVLADALEDSRCADSRILEHCRGPRLHFRGCWVVEMILGNN